MKVLLVEDDLPLARGLAQALKRHGFAVDHVARGRDAVNSMGLNPPDLVVLDLGLPDMDGMAVLKKLRHQKAALPVLILTARDALNDKVVALDGGADDYLSKPFEIEELLARLRVLSRRLSTSLSSEIRLDSVTLDQASQKVTVDGEPVALSRREFMLLNALMQNAGRIQTREVLENKLYGWGEEIASNAIEAHISYLRKKLPRGFIQTIRGVGYTISIDQQG